MSPKNMKIKYKNTSYFEDRIRAVFFCHFVCFNRNKNGRFVNRPHETNMENTTSMHKK